MILSGILPIRHQHGEPLLGFGMITIQVAVFAYGLLGIILFYVCGWLPRTNGDKSCFRLGLAQLLLCWAAVLIWIFNIQFFLLPR